jgi:PEGA domain
MSTTDRRVRIIIATLIVLLAAAFIWVIVSVGNAITTSNNGTVKFTVVPSDATLVIDSHTTTKSDTLSLAPGTHQVTFSRNGFNTQTITVTVAKGQTITQTIILTTANSTGVSYIENHPNEAAISDGVASAIVQKNGQIITSNNPLIELLPYVGADYDIDYGVSKKYPTNRDAVAIYITATTSAGRAHALNWITAQGFNPAAYEIIYQSSIPND